MFWRALAVYAAGFLGVAIVARAAVIAIGLPDWVFSGALIVMALGLPVILFTGYTQHVARRMAAATPTFTPGGTPSLASARGTMATLAVKASPHVSWNRAIRGGILAVGAFALLVAGYMVMRALGIGPAGSLFASGRLAASDKLVVAAFDAPASDSSLGSTLAEAVRTNLSQSRAVHVVPASMIVSALEEMKRPDTARVDYATAREIAQRIGAKGVVTGSIVPAGTGYLITVRLAAAETGDELASFRASARDAGELIPAVDRLTKSLRGKMGESLKAVRAAPSLDRVTTGSLGALRSYAAGLRANDIVGDYPSAIQNFRDAIRQDSTFAMAHVQLAYSLMTLGGPARNAEAQTELTTAFRLRDRLPERERYNVEGAYYTNVAPDRRRAITAFRRAIEVDSANYDAANSLAIVLDDTRDSAGAESMYRLALAGLPGNGTILTNLALMYIGMGRHAAFDSVMAEIAAGGIPFSTTNVRRTELWSRRDYDGAERLTRAAADTANPRAAINAQNMLATFDLLRGRLRQGEQRYLQFVGARARVLGDTTDALSVAWFQALLEGELRGDTARGLALLDATLRSAPPQNGPLSRDQSLMTAYAYARLGAPARARDVLRRYEARLDTLAGRQQVVMVRRVRGAIAMAEGKTDSAIATFRASDTELDGLPTRNCTVCLPLLLGLVYDASRQADSARKYLTEYAEMPGTDRAFIDRYYLGPSLYRLGELYENAGDTRHATEYYGRFVELWQHADAELQPKVTEARNRMERLTRLKG
jgi:tetratricopeptide (TPR) repeat protein